MKRVVLTLVLLVLCGVVAVLWLGRPLLLEWLRPHLEQAVAAAVGSPSRIDAIDLSLVPLKAGVRGVAVGAAPPLAEVGWLEVRVFPLASLAEGRLVLAVYAGDVALDVSRLPPAEPQVEEAEQQGGGGLLPVHLRDIEISNLRLRVPLIDEPVDLSVRRAKGQMRVAVVGEHAAVLSLAEVQLQRAARRLLVEEIHIDGGADAAGVFVNTAALKGEGISLSVGGSGLAKRKHTASLALDLGQLGVLSESLAFIGGEARLEATLKGDLLGPALDGKLVVRKAALGSVPLGKLSADLKWGAALRVNNLLLEAPSGKVTGSAQLSLAGRMPLQAELQLQRVDLDELLRTVGQPLQSANRFDAKSSISGTLSPLDLGIEASAVVQAASEPTKQAASIEVTGQIRSDNLGMRLVLTQPEGNELRADVVVAGAALDGDVHVAVADLAALGAIAPRQVRQLELSGQVDGDVTLAGTVDEPRIGARVSLRQVGAAGVTLPAAGAEFSIAGAQMTLDKLSVATPTGGLEMQGAVALGAAAANDWRLELSDLDIDLLTSLARGVGGTDLPLSRGTLSGSVTCRGSWSRAQLQAALTASAPTIGPEPFQRVEIELAAALPQWKLEATAVHTQEESVRLEASGEAAERVRLTVESTPFGLANLRGAFRRDLRGTVSVRGALSGPPTRLDGQLELRAVALGLDAHEVGDITLRAEARRGDWRLTGAALDEALGIEASLRPRDAMRYTLGLRWQDASLSRLLAAQEVLQIVTSGTVDLSGSLRDPTGASGRIRVSRLDLSRDEHRVTASTPILLDLGRGRLRIRSFDLAGPGSRLTLAGELSAAGEVQLEVGARADLVLLELVGEPVSSARGQLELAARVQRTPQRGWDLRGHATLRDVVLDMGLPIAFTDTNAALTLEGGTIRIDELKGRAGGGEVGVAGTLALDEGPDLTWSLRDVALSTEEGIEVQVAGNGTVRGSWKVINVGGDIEILNALYDRDIAIADMLPFFKEQVMPAPRAQAPATEVRLDLRVYSRGGIFIDNNVAKAELWVNLRVTGAAHKPALAGEVGFLSGQVSLGERTFTITSGAIDFRKRLGIVPFLNIAAESEVATGEADYTVSVVVSGRADNPRVQFTADDPNLSQNDVLSLATFGKTTAQLQREGGGVTAADALALLPTAGVEERVGKLVGVDRFEIEATQARNTGAIEPRVTIGKDLTERLRALVSTSFGVEARRQVQLEYRLTRRISLLGSWEGETESEAGAFGGDVKFRYEFRKLPFSLFGCGASTPGHSDGR